MDKTENLLKNALAHINTLDNKKHYLYDHLSAVSKKTGAFAQKLKLKSLGNLIGLLHDIGKINPQFQKYLLANEDEKNKYKCKHSPVGALIAKIFDKSLISINPIAAHHTFLYEHHELKDVKLPQWEKEFSSLHFIKEEFLKFNFDFNSLSRELHNLCEIIKNETDLELIIRFLYSCLIDADWLDTEEFFSPQNKNLRTHFSEVSLLNLKSKYIEFISKLKSNVSKKTLISKARNEINEICLRMGQNTKRGLYQLTVPTGGGKTLSSLGFALEHAIANNIDRIIYAIPYTSIIDQISMVFRDIFQSKYVVLEHHSNVNYVANVDDNIDEVQINRFASQNWDAKLILTTTVQLFDSMFSNKPQDCRKLHNILNSIIIIDEVQTLPLNLFEPILSLINFLIKVGNCSVVLCTATQPNINNKVFANYNLHPTELVTDTTIPNIIFSSNKVKYNYKPEKITIPELVDKICENKQILCICNTKQSAKLIALGLLNRLKIDKFSLETTPVFHLSTNMCSKHRRKVIEIIKKRLQNDLNCLVISTQLIEAGIDLDFPVVYRALGPLERIIQAAGRCNREGKLENGNVFIFELLDEKPPSNLYSSQTNITRKILNNCSLEKIFDFEYYINLINNYYDHVFNSINLDNKNIQQHRKRLDFPKVEELGHLINYTIPVIVNYQNAYEVLKDILIEKRNEFGLTFHDFIKIQPYLVNLPKSIVQKNPNIFFKYDNFNIIKACCNYNEFTGVDIEHSDIEDYIF